MISSIFMIILIISLIFINSRIKRETLNVAQIQNIIWLTAFVLYATNFFNYYPISEEVCILAGIYLISFNFAYLGKHNYLSINEDLLADLANSVEEARVRKRVIVSSCLSWILALPLLLKSLPILSQYGMSAMRWILYGEQSYFSGLEMCIISYIIRPIATVAILFFAEEIATKRIRKSIVFVVLADAFLLILLTAGRALLEQLVIYVALVLLVVYGANIKKILYEYRKYLIAAVIILVLIVQVSSQRISRSNGAVKEVLIYIFSSMPYLSALISQGLATAQYSICLYTTSFLVQPIVLALQIFGVNLSKTFDLASFTSNLVEIGENAKMNAVGSTLLPFYLDLGYLGPFVFGIMIALFMNRQERKLSVQHTRLAFGRYLFLVNGTILSIQNFQFSGVSTFATWVLMWFILR